MREFPCDTHVILASGARETHLRTTRRKVATARRRESDPPLVLAGSPVPMDVQEQPQEPQNRKVTPSFIVENILNDEAIATNLPTIASMLRIYSTMKL